MAYEHLGEHVGASDVCMDCRSELAAFTTGWQLCEQCRRRQASAWEEMLSDDPTNATPAAQEQHRRSITQLVDNDLWTLTEYLAWINRPEPGVMKGELMGADDWKEVGITKASDLGEYLDDCVERERRKDGM